MSTTPSITQETWPAVARRQRQKLRPAAIIRLWRRRSRTRRALKTLDARLLADIGRTDAERRHECAKWFWQI
jgi:uncharacterized protein YjiS (DUF1127 family)